MSQTTKYTVSIKKAHVDVSRCDIFGYDVFGYDAGRFIVSSNVYCRTNADQQNHEKISKYQFYSKLTEFSKLQRQRKMSP